MLYKQIIKLIAFIGLVQTTLTEAKQGSSHQSSMLPGGGDGVTNSQLKDADGEDQVDEISTWLVESIEGLLPLVAIGVFLFVGIKLAIAKGNPEEFKKAWMQFVYAIIGIFAVSFAWVTVKLVAGLSF